MAVGSVVRSSFERFNIFGRPVFGNAPGKGSKACMGLGKGQGSEGKSGKSGKKNHEQGNKGSEGKTGKKDSEGKSGKKGSEGNMGSECKIGKKGSEGKSGNNGRAKVSKKAMKGLRPKGMPKPKAKAQAASGDSSTESEAEVEAATGDEIELLQSVGQRLASIARRWDWWQGKAFGQGQS